MARLPSGCYLIQQADGMVRLFEEYTEALIVVFDPADGIAVADALDDIRDSELGDKDKCFACFWSGYFHAYANRDPAVPRELFVIEAEGGDVIVMDEGTEVVRFSPADANAAARAQKPIDDCALSADDKNRAHFWSGFAYAQASA